MKSLAIKSLIIFSTLSILYLGYNLSRQNQANQIAETYSSLAKIHTPLLQNYLSLSQLPSLSLDSPEFETEQDRLLSSITNSRESVLDSLKDNPLSEDSTYSNLLQDTKDHLESQQSFLDSYQPDSQTTQDYLQKTSSLLEQYTQHLQEIKDQATPYLPASY